MSYIITHGSLFTGLGIFDKASEALGIQNVFGCDSDAFCAAHYAEKFGHEFFHDVTSISALPKCDILTFGFPCQDASNAANEKKSNPLDHARTGLFYEAIRLIRISRPQWVVAENVAALRNKGLAEVLTQFTESGYSVGYAILPASRFGALHRRERLIIVANANRQRWRSVGEVLGRIIEAAKPSYDVERQRYRKLLPPIQLEAYREFLGEPNGHAASVFAGLRAKAIGNSIYYPLALSVIQSIKTQIEKER